MIAALILSVAMTGQCANGQCYAPQARVYYAPAQVVVQAPVVRYQVTVRQPVAVYAAPQAVAVVRPRVFLFPRARFARVFPYLW